MIQESIRALSHIDYPTLTQLGTGIHSSRQPGIVQTVLLSNISVGPCKYVKEGYDLD